VGHHDYRTADVRESIPNHPNVVVQPGKGFGVRLDA
jgi:hypothetical protein